MDEEAALLRAICENPDEDTPRLVFADWLTEHGGPLNVAWANGIRAQVWQARGDSDAALAQQSRIFQSSYRLEKLCERIGVPRGMVSNWERGFPGTVVAPFARLRDVWPGMAFRVPMRKLLVYGLNEAHTAEFVT